jgi:hypothetical protein
VMKPFIKLHHPSGDLGGLSGELEGPSRVLVVRYKCMFTG